MPGDFKSFMMEVIRDKDKVLVMKKRMEIEMTYEFHEMFEKLETQFSKRSNNPYIIGKNMRLENIPKSSIKSKYNELEEDKLHEDPAS